MYIGGPICIYIGGHLGSKVKIDEVNSSAS